MFPRTEMKSFQTDVNEGGNDSEIVLFHAQPRHHVLKHLLQSHLRICTAKKLSEQTQFDNVFAQINSAILFFLDPRCRFTNVQRRFHTAYSP